MTTLRSPLYAAFRLNQGLRGHLLPADRTVQTGVSSARTSTVGRSLWTDQRAE